MKLLTVFLFFLILFFIIPARILAAEYPLEQPNNKFGIHILFPDELQTAADLVNSSGGDWGYVTIPIQIKDLNLTKWQKFMDDCRTLHLIPIIRIATTNDYFQTNNWGKPTVYDVIDFANFLNSLEWPTQNRYVIIFNEINRADEWGGDVNPAEYAQLLSSAVSIFKARNQDFFVISAGLDNAAANVPNVSMDEFYYMRAMNQAVPGIFYQVDGLASHSYPNPAFSAPPSKVDGESIASFVYEKQVIQQLGGKDLPIFITETGWSNKNISDQTISQYYQTALLRTWSDPSIVAITPFLLKASGVFSEFSFINDSGKQSLVYNTWKAYPKVKGSPRLAGRTVLGAESTNIPKLPLKDFRHESPKNTSVTASQKLQRMLELFFSN